MTVEVVGTTVEVLGKAYQLKCPENEIPLVQKAAQFLEEKMREIREMGHVLSVDRIAVLAALSLAHKLLRCEHEKDIYAQMVNEKLLELENKLEQVQSPQKELEL